MTALFLAPVVLVLTLLFLERVIRKRQRSALYLMISSGMDFVAITVALIGDLQGFKLGYYLPWMAYLTPIFYFFVVLGVYSYFLFCTEIFWTDLSHRVKILYLVWGLSSAILFLLPFNNWGAAYDADVTFRLFAQTYIVSYVIFSFAVTARKAFQTANRLQPSAEKTAVWAIGLASCILLAGIFCSLFNTVVRLISGIRLSIFQLLSWLLFVVGIIVWYFAIYPSERLINLIKKAAKGSQVRGLVFKLLIITSLVLLVFTLFSVLTNLFLAPLIPPEIIVVTFLIGVISSSLLLVWRIRVCIQKD
ncbi:MAG: hypothetical protein RBG13Loki_0922 [Promethearchaeota archaeon CR_4]|nr:MAG: hypothetical protein RBG13Loki_0922 [Candidatus Lokiarchaeota archaeon CR_4]